MSIEGAGTNNSPAHRAATPPPQSGQQGVSRVRPWDRALSALLPLKVSGRHYGDNLARLDLLFSSLTHYGAPGLLDELLVVARADEVDVVGRHLAAMVRVAAPDPR